MRLKIVTPMLFVSGMLASLCASADEGWDRFYVGGSLGERKVTADWKTTSYQDPGGASLPFGTDPSASLDSRKQYFDLFAGKNWNVGSNLLLGVEGRIGNADNEKTHQT
ncbi:MAG TPA: hypothetical protein VFM30_08630, partial [Steroidobacteraceae bacterium]|nr:hypothetical protein [Steroidobacteraceae bacterium]